MRDLEMVRFDDAGGLGREEMVDALMNFGLAGRYGMGDVSESI